MPFLRGITITQDLLMITGSLEEVVPIIIWMIIEAITQSMELCWIKQLKLFTRRIIQLEWLMCLKIKKIKSLIRMLHQARFLITLDQKKLERCLQRLLLVYLNKWLIIKVLNLFSITIWLDHLSSLMNKILVKSTFKWISRQPLIKLISTRKRLMSLSSMLTLRNNNLRCNLRQWWMKATWWPLPVINPKAIFKFLLRANSTNNNPPSKTKISSNLFINNNHLKSLKDSNLRACMENLPLPTPQILRLI